MTNHQVLKKIMVLVGEKLTLYHIIKTFNAPDEKSLLKTLWEKEKMLVTSIFSFFHIFNPMKDEFCVSSNIVICQCFTYQQFKFCGLTLYHTIPTFNDPR